MDVIAERSLGALVEDGRSDTVTLGTRVRLPDTTLFAEAQLNPRAIQDFAELVQDSPYVLECYVVSGNQYALLHVAAPDMRTYSEFVLDRLRRIPGVKDLNSNFVMRVIKSAGGIPDMTQAAHT